MFFPKKLTFLQYWVQLKNSSVELSRARSGNAQIRGLFQQVKKTNIVPLTSFSVASLPRQINSIKDSSLHESIEAKGSYQSTINHNRLTTPVVLGQFFSHPKPWYNYWILPFVGFITILPTLTPCRDSNSSFVFNNSNYGFKYLNAVKTQFVISHKCLLNDDKLSNVEQVLPMPKVIISHSSGSTKDFVRFPRNLRNWNSSNNNAFSRPLWYQSKITNLSGNTVGTGVLNRALRMSVANTRTPSMRKHIVPSLSKYEELNHMTSLRNSLLNSIKLSNVMRFTTAKTNTLYLNDQITGQNLNPVRSYKMLETYFDLLAKQLFFSKDLLFQKAFFTTASSVNFNLNLNTDVQGTSTLLQLLQKYSLTPIFEIEGQRSFDQQFDDVQSIKGCFYPTADSQATFRFLPSYQDALYFYTYITKTPTLVKENHEVSLKTSEFSIKKGESFFKVTPSLLTKLDSSNNVQLFENNLKEQAPKTQINMGDSEISGNLLNHTVDKSSISSKLSANATELKSALTNKSSYVQSLDIQFLKASEVQETGVNRHMLISKKRNEMSNNNVPKLTQIGTNESYMGKFQKYLNYIQSRLLISLQLYYQDKELNLQSRLVLKTKKLANLNENQSELFFKSFKPYYLKHGSKFSELEKEPLKYNSLQTSTNFFQKTKKYNLQLQTNTFQHFNYKRKVHKSQEKFIRNLSFNEAIKKVTQFIQGKKKFSQRDEKKQPFMDPSRGKQLQNLLRKSSHDQVVLKHNKKVLPLLDNRVLKLKGFNINSKLTQRSSNRLQENTPGSSRHLNMLIPDAPLTKYDIQPMDLLRIKHFIFLSNREKSHYKYYPTLQVILKDEKLLYETLIRQNQQQKRRKKKRKRWTRRRRKRKRKLLRPIWTTIQLAKVLNSRRLRSSAKNSFLVSPLSPNTTSVFLNPLIAFSNKTLVPSISTRYSTKHFYRLSKKSLVEFTNNKFYKTKVKTFLKDFETIQVAKTKRWLKAELLNQLIEGQVGSKTLSQLRLSSKLEASVLLEYNRIMYERLQAFFINYSSNIDKTMHRQHENRLPALASGASYSKINSFHSKIIHNAPKEEWVWLFKYITGEIPPNPINSSKDQLRSIWAMSKLQSTNQWTGWKNFYYQEFKKGLTPTYELWQDKKPDKRYNVNNLKKRQYKHMKQLQRLRLSPQLHRGTYFALQRDVTKLNILGSLDTRKGQNLAKGLTDTKLVNRPIDKLRLTLKSLNTLSSTSSVSEVHTQRPDVYLNYLEQTKMFKSSTSFITTSKKPILDLYATWWDNADATGWGWKTIQYGAPWDRKTLYIPSKLISNTSIKYSSILNGSLNLNNKNNWFTTSHLQPASTLNFPVTITSEFPSSILLLTATIVFHMCALLGLISLAEVRYSTKVNLILAYKLSTIPLKLINTVIQPLFKENVSSQETGFDFKPQPVLLTTERTAQVTASRLLKLFSAEKNTAPTTLSFTKSPLPTSVGATTKISPSLNIYKFSFYGSLKQLIKKVMRQKTNQIQINSSQKLGSVTEISLSELNKFEQQKFVLKTTLNGTKMRRMGLQFSYSTYYAAINFVERLIDNFRDTTRSVYDFFSLPENFSPNPDEVGLDVLANFIYDFEEPLIELLPDIIETQTEKYLDRYLLTLNLFGPAGLFVHQRCKWFYRMFIGLMYQADADYRKDEEELHSLYTIWAEILNKAAEDLDLEATVIASQEDQRILLLEHLLLSNLLEQTKSRSKFQATQGQILFGESLTGLTKVGETGPTTTTFNNSVSSGTFFRSRKYKNSIDRFTTFKSNEQRDSSVIQTLITKLNLSSRNFSNLNEYDSNTFSPDQLSKSKLASTSLFSTWAADQYVLYKTDETDLFIEINIPKSFASMPAIKHWDTLHQPLGLATCQIYSGLLTKQMAKNILLIADNTAEKTQILQALAGETEVKLILDNSSRYASISQSVAVGMRLLRDVFEAVALQTPCIFVLEDIHLIGEKRPFLISDEDLALVTNSGLGLEQHQLYEKIQKIQQHSKHRISYFKKAYRGDAADSLPTNLLCYDIFLTDQPRTEWISPNYPIPVDFHADLNETYQGEFSSDTRKEKVVSGTRPISHLLLSETQVSYDSTNTKISQFVTEPILSTKFDENQQKQNTSLSLRGKVSSIADGALSNISVKLDRITQLLVIMDNVRKNKGFIVFGTTNKPQILDPALRRPGRLEETIYLPSIPNILTKWETLNSQIKSSSEFTMKYGYSKITLDLFSVYNSLQKSPPLNQKNFLLTLANSIPSNQASTTAFMLTSSRTGQVANAVDQLSKEAKHYHVVKKQTSIIKMQFINQLLTEAKIARSQKRKIPLLKSNQLSPFERKNVEFENLRVKKFLSEIIGTSYEHIAKSIFEVLTRQTSTNILLFKASSVQKQFGHLEDTIYLKLYSDKELFKNELIFVFAGILANYFASFGSLDTQINMRGNTKILQTNKTMLRNPVESTDLTKDPNWQLATTLIYSYIQKRALYNKNTYIQKLFNRNYGSINSFTGPPTTTLLLPAKRYESYLRAERDYEQTSFSHRTLSLQNKIQLHLNQRVLKRLYRLPIKEFYKSEIIENSLTTFSSSNFVLPNNTRNFAQQNQQSKTNFYYRNIFLNRHRHYLTNQWWTGHLTEYNIENTVMSEIDFRSYFVDKTKVSGFTGDLILDFPDADQHYNFKHRRWYLQSTSWKSWYDLEKGLTTDIMNHYIIELYTQTYRVLDNNRELLDQYVAKLLVNYQLQEIEVITDLKQFT